ncbi:hypothetical protein ACEN2T_23330 [Pseudomonas sp. W22_MBD1_FP4]|uniref:hypothetical protein n=1 Tax=Pseudomonas sp. W22_MBD1_FP4 TaxID=3240272 RepID=UPI003F9CF96B
MSLLDELDESMETVGEIANHLEAQMGRYERGSPPLFTWLSNRLERPEELAKASRDTPQSPLICAWIMQPGFTASSMGNL